MTTATCPRRTSSSSTCPPPPRAAGPRAWRSAPPAAGVLLAVGMLAAPGTSEATLALKLLTGGLTFLGATADTVSLYSAFGSGPSDDHPLWGNGTSSPNLQIVATETTFDLLLQQPNDVGEFEDDLSVQLQGVVEGPIRNDAGQTTGTGNLWEFSITLEANLGSGATSLSALGYVKHLWAPHPELGEQPNGAPLAFDLSLSKSCTGSLLCTWTSGAMVDSGIDDGRHQTGPHWDKLKTAELSFNCCSTYLGEIDSFQVKLSAVHAVPEPEAVMLAMAGLGVVGVAGIRRGRCVGTLQQV